MVTTNKFSASSDDFHIMEEYGFYLPSLFLTFNQKRLGFSDQENTKMTTFLVVKIIRKTYRCLFNCWMFYH
jgi:hypothetical protein